MDEKFNSIPVSVIHFDKDGTVTDVEDYNLDKVEPASWALKGLAAALLPVIREFYTHEDNVRAFGAWLKIGKIESWSGFELFQPYFFAFNFP